MTRRSKRVLVCGGREYCKWGTVNGVLSQLDDEHNIEAIIQGGAKGADFLAKAWAIWAGIPWAEYPADWKTHGYRAGPIRNQEMLDGSKPDLVVAFPGGNGTADMVRRAKAAGVEVVTVEDA